MNLPDEYALLPEGQHSRLLCPKCGGGSSGERSFSVLIENGGYAWHCFRASCGWSGHSGVVHKRDTFTNNEQRKAIDRDLPGYTRHAIYDNEMNCRGWEHRIKSMVPVKNEREMREVQYMPQYMPKSKLNIDSDWCGLHFPFPIRGEWCLLVEDRRSAEKMFPLFPAVALMGTNLNQEKIDYLISQGIKSAIIALDDDATAKAIGIWASVNMVKGMIQLDKDIKDQPMHKLLELANQCYEKIK